MMDLILHIKAEYFHQIDSGKKSQEFRLENNYWKKRLENRHYDRVVIYLGYPAKNDTSRRIIKSWRGYVKRTIIHPHFGNKPTRVYAINIGQ
jgi:hypothetical protein